MDSLIRISMKTQEFPQAGAHTCLLLLGLVFEAVMALVGAEFEPGLRAEEEEDEEVGATNCCWPWALTT